MGLFGKNKMNRLLDRLFGKNNVDCMNVQRGSGGLIAELEEELVELRLQLVDVNIKLAVLEETKVSKATKKTTKVKAKKAK